MTGKRNKPNGRLSSSDKSRPSRTPQRRGEPTPSWSQFAPAVLGSLIIRLDALGYAPLFGRTSDGGRLTFSLYRDGVRESRYLGRSATTASLLQDVADMVGVVIPAPRPAEALVKAPTKPVEYLDWMRSMGMTEKQIEASCRANGRVYAPPIT